MGNMAEKTLTRSPGTARSIDVRKGADRNLPGVLMSAGGILGALATSACCVLPLALVSVGVTGAWMGNLTALAPYRPAFIGVTLALLAGGFAMVYRKPKAASCEEGASCARPVSHRLTKTMLWIGTALIAGGLGFSYLAPTLY